MATLCGHGRPIALATLQNAVFRSFPAFPCFSAFSSDSGGPTLPPEPFWPEWPELPEYASLRLSAIWDTLGTLDPDRGKRSGALTPGRLNQPVSGFLGFQACILLEMRKVTVLAFLVFAETFLRKTVRRR